MDVKDLIDTLIDEGCDIWAIGENAYVMGEPLDISSSHTITEILQEFGDRDRYKKDIVRYLRLIGRVVDVRPQ